MYTKKLLKVIAVAIIFSFICVIANSWIFEGDWIFLPFPFIAGIFMVFIQKEKNSYNFIDKLFISSLIFGFLALLLIYSRMYLIAEDFPFWPTYNPKEYLTFSLIFSFVSFLGGLVGIVIKGFYSIIQNK